MGCVLLFVDMPKFVGRLGLRTEVEDQESGSCEMNTKANIGGRLVIERLSRKWSST